MQIIRPHLRPFKYLGSEWAQFNPKVKFHQPPTDSHVKTHTTIKSGSFRKRLTDLFGDKRSTWRGRADDQMRTYSNQHGDLLVGCREFWTWSFEAPTKSRQNWRTRMKLGVSDSIVSTSLSQSLLLSIPYYCRIALIMIWVPVSKCLFSSCVCPENVFIKSSFS